MIENKRIQIRRDIAQNWTTKNPVLLYGEVGFDITANNIKIGDGVTPWNSLEYISAKVDLSEYYTKEQVDDLIKRIDMPDLTQYYTKEETETYVQEQIQGIEFPTTDLSDYYTKEETDTQISTAIDNIEIPKPDLTQYYTKEETETKIEEGIQSIDIPETDLSNYYTKEETETIVDDKIDNKQWFGTQEEYDALEEKDPNTVYYIEGVQQEVDLSGYYTKEETETYVQEQIQGIEFPTTDLSDYYTKEETDTQISTAIDNIEIPKPDLTQYYTKEETETVVDDKIDDKQWYGTQEEFDALESYDPDVIYHVEMVTEENVGDLIDKKLWFGTQEEFNALENKDENVTYYVEVENSVVADMSNYYTKSEIDALLAQINNG